jgi:hypothetical protein
MKRSKLIALQYESDSLAFNCEVDRQWTGFTTSGPLGALNC